MIDRRTLIGAAAGLTVASTACGQDRSGPTPADRSADAPQWPPAEHFALWPGTAPGAPDPLPTENNTMNGPAGRRELWLRGVSRPVVGVFRPAKPDGRAVLSIPGGGYGFVSIHNEGMDVAKALNPQGITVFALAYRLPGEGWANRGDAPLADAQRAMRLIRARAGSFGIDPAKLGVLGFSAGGHLGAILSVGHADRTYAPLDAADRLSARPAYAGLVYPVTSFVAAGLNTRSGETLLGPDPEAALLARHTADTRVTAETPPLFLVHAIDDPVVPLGQSQLLLDAAQRHKVPVEAHFFEKGGHGFGPLRMKPDLPARFWPEMFASWTAGR